MLIDANPIPASCRAINTSVSLSVCFIGDVNSDASVSCTFSPKTRSTISAALLAFSGSLTVSCKETEPIDFFRPSGVSSATMRPLSITMIRSASWSASSRYCVVSNMVEPFFTSRLMVCHIWALVRGSSPVVGSSRKMSGGQEIRLAARSSLRRIPPENSESLRFAASVSPNSSRSSLALSFDSSRERPSNRPKITRFSVAVSSSSTDANCPVSPISRRTFCVSFSTSWPKIFALPASGFDRVASILITVVFPAPFGPSTPQMVPAGIEKLTPSTALLFPNVFTRSFVSTAKILLVVLITPFCHLRARRAPPHVG